MSNDLISRSALLEKSFCAAPATMSNPYGGDLVVRVEDIENAPAVDAVEVVRCGKCRYSKDGHVCVRKAKYGGSVDRVRPNFFCAAGKWRVAVQLDPLEEPQPIRKESNDV